VSDLRAAWEAEAANWARFARTPDHDYWHARFNWPCFLELLPAPRGPVLDLGCGEGRAGRVLRALGHAPVIGVDASPTLAAMARERGDYDEVVNADAAALPLGDDSVDLVIAFMSLHDMDDLDGALREAARVLRRGGRVCAALVHPYHSAGLAGAYFATRRYTDHHERDGVALTFHSIHRSLEAVSAAFTGAGLLLEEVREPAPDDAAVADHPDLARAQSRPVFLHLRALGLR
jgi:SAM-dependent methyltransferase